MNTSARVLTDPELDILELALGGGIPTPGLDDLPDGTVLSDSENTPLARVEAGTLTALKPFAHTPGPQWDPAVRVAPARLGAQMRDAVAIIIAEPPTRDDVGRLRASLNGVEQPILVVAPVSRGAVLAGHVGAPGLTRAALDLADSLRAEGHNTRAVAVPWPVSPRGATLSLAGVTLNDIVRRCGAAWVRLVTENRTADEDRRIADLPRVRRDAVDALYAPAQAVDVERALAGAGHRGAVVLFTGLSGSGKSTVASALRGELEDDGIRTTQLDGDEVRQFLSRGLGFDRASREANVERIGYVASLVAHHGGIAIAAPIAPFAGARRRVRELAETAGAVFVLVYISTPLEVCEARDRKGLYAKARVGEIPDFTGISSPYEVPDDADLVIDTSTVEIDDAVARVRALLESRLTGR
ncbi:adenylyl-sulfate kinase [Microbacterium sp. KR10-403]|uniref:adenylyl-sulfate kinase n=1 Tax=Microbacterium sp. KR10-403 TaxID=3158581 RepID=UPI0032E452E9